jgi:hypothetical protein
VLVQNRRRGKSVPECLRARHQRGHADEAVRTGRLSGAAYVLDIKPGHEVPDMRVVQDAMTEKLCASAMCATTGSRRLGDLRILDARHPPETGAKIQYRGLPVGPNCQLTERRRLPALWDVFISRICRSRCTAPNAVRLRCRKLPRTRLPSCRSVRPRLRLRPDRIAGVL